MIVVKSHKRKSKNCVSVVKKHVRKAIKKYGITTPISIDVNHKSNQHDSLAHHAMHYDEKKKKPVKHELNFDKDKIKKSGENFSKTAKHEVGHLVDTELAYKKGKMKKATDTISNHLKMPGKPKRKSKKEYFANNYAETK